MGRATAATMFLSNFNSIKVRLEHLQRPFRCWLVSFQFHKGTIRTSGNKTAKSKGNYFNSIKVRLELSLRPYTPSCTSISIP